MADDAKQKRITDGREAVDLLRVDHAHLGRVIDRVQQLEAAVDTAISKLRKLKPYIGAEVLVKNAAYDHGTWITLPANKMIDNTIAELLPLINNKPPETPREGL